MAQPKMSTLYPSHPRVPGGGANNATYNTDGTVKIRQPANKPVGTVTEGKDLGSAGNVLVTGVALNKSTTTKTVGQTETLTVTWTPSNATDKTGTWRSSDPSKCTVNASGLITGVAAGTAVITFTSNDKKKTATCTVTVS